VKHYGYVSRFKYKSNLNIMKTKIFKSVMLALVFTIFCILLKISLGAVDHVYAVSATSQLDSDSAYYFMEIQGEITMLVKAFFTAILSLHFFFGYKIWETKD